MPQSVSNAQIRAFNAVAREGSMSAAARRLGLSQPAISAQIRALESAFGVILFERINEGLRMTTLARRLYGETKEISAIEEAARDILISSATLEWGDIHVMCGAPNPAMRLIAEFRRLYPGVTVTATFGNWHEVTRALHDQACDAVVLTDVEEDEGVERVPFQTQSIVALVRRDNALARSAEPLTLEQLRQHNVIFRTGQSLTQRSMEAALRRARLTVEPVLTLGEREAVYEAVMQGLGIGFMFEHAISRADPAVAHLKVAGLDNVHVEHVACLARNLRRREVKALMALAREMAVSSM